MVYVSAGIVVEESDDTTLIDGVPILAVEILSPQTKIEKILVERDVAVSW